MAHSSGRYAAANAPSVAAGWRLERLTPPSALYGANGLRAGRDGRIYIAQASGSQISAVHLVSGDVEAVSPLGSDILGPDDLAFGPDGTIYATELQHGCIGVRDPDGRTRVLAGGLPAANGITFHQGRLFVDECRIGGRVVEVPLDGGAPRVLVEGVPMSNACEVGPDGKLYFPVMGANEIWRVGLDGGAPEVVVGDLGIPDAVKFDVQGFIVSTQLGSGELLRIDPRSGARTVLAAMEPGLDNLTFMGERLFVSHIRGELYEIAAGEARPILKGGLVGPFGLALADDGGLYVADGGHLFVLRPDGVLAVAGRLHAPGWPGYVRGIAAAGGGVFAVTTAVGAVVRYAPSAGESEMLAEGLDQPHGVALAPDGAVLACELGAGRVLRVRAPGEVEVIATGLSEPRDVTVTADGDVLVSESAAGRVVKLSGGRVDTVLDGLVEPHGLVARDGLLYVLDFGAKALVALDVETGVRQTLAADLPVGPPPGVIPKPMPGLPPFSGPVRPFADLEIGPDGTLYICADGDGSLLALRRLDR